MALIDFFLNNDGLLHPRGLYDADHQHLIVIGDRGEIEGAVVWQYTNMISRWVHAVQLQRRIREHRIGPPEQPQ